MHRFRLGDAPLKAGEYRFIGPQTVEQVLSKLIRGEVVGYPVTIPEGWDIDETTAHLVAGGFGRREAFLAAMRDPGAIRDLDPRASNLEGYLFPDTYSFAKGTAESEIVAAMVRGLPRPLRRGDRAAAPVARGTPGSARPRGPGEPGREGSECRK